MQRRVGLVIIAVIAVAIFLAWLLGGKPSHTSDVPADRPPVAAVARLPPPQAPPPPAPKRPVGAPAIQLARAVDVHSMQTAVPGALEGVVVDAETDGGIAAAELTFSHDDGAYSTITGPGGAFRFAPTAPGTYRLDSIEARGYAAFEREFGRSPVSFTSIPGKDVSGVVLRLEPEKARPHRRRKSAEKSDAGPPPMGSLHGHVVDARSGAPIAAFAVAVWKRSGIVVSAMMPASFVDPSGAYEIGGLDPGTYEVAAMAAGYASSTYAVAEVTDSPVQVDIGLRSGARLEGIVTDDATSSPLGGVELSLEGRRGDAPDLPVAPLSPEAETGPDGRFTLEHVPPDAVSLRATKKGYLVRLVSLGSLPADGTAPFLPIALTPRESGADASVELTGIGAVLRAREDVLEIQQVVPDAGAADAGLVQGDEIVAIDGALVTALGFERAIGAIRGPVGSTVSLRIRRAGRETDVLVARKLVRR